MFLKIWFRTNTVKNIYVASFFGLLLYKLIEMEESQKPILKHIETGAEIHITQTPVSC